MELRGAGKAVFAVALAKAPSRKRSCTHVLSPRPTTPMQYVFAGVCIVPETCQKGMRVAETCFCWGSGYVTDTFTLALESAKLEMSAYSALGAFVGADLEENSFPEWLEETSNVTAVLSQRANGSRVLGGMGVVRRLGGTQLTTQG